MRLEGLGKFKKINLIGIRSRDLPACIIVPQPTTLPRAPHNTWWYFDSTVNLRAKLFQLVFMSRQ
jgi:hypothetical protein